VPQTITLSGWKSEHRLIPGKDPPMASPDTLHFVNLRKELTDLRTQVASTGTVLTQAQRDMVAIGQAEALADIAATLNAGISVSTS
jgi:hypothetical protein